MITIGEALHILSSQGLPTRPEPLALFNFLLNYCETTEPLTSVAFEQFFRRAYSYPHWRENKAELIKAAEEAVRQLNRQAANACLDPEAMLAAGHSQVIEIERLVDLKEMLSRHIESQIHKGDRYRLLSQPGQRVLAILLLQTGTLRLSLYTNWGTLRAGRIIPLIDDMHVTYSPQLELASQQMQHLELAPNIVCRWKVSDNGYHGHILRGYTLQRFELLNGGPITNYPNLFYPLKRLEQYFINRKSDPLYVEITSLLEKASALLQSAHPEAQKFAQSTLKRAQAAYEHIFTEDRLMGLLIRDLTRGLAEPEKAGPESWQKSNPPPPL